MIRPLSVLRARVVVGLAILNVGVIFYLLQYLPTLASWKPHYNPQNEACLNNLCPANATLGFGALLSVSRKNGPRQRGLIKAANLTGLEITIPVQPEWTDADEANFRSTDGKSVINHGSSLAWLGHLNALRYFLSTGAETALILEDDVDWDISLRRIQIPLASRAVNQLFNTPSQGPSFEYWSSPSNWEILYLGHCGDFPTSYQPLKEHTLYPDFTLPLHQRLTEKTRRFLEEHNLPWFYRLLSRSRSPLCTFGYGVTRASAQRILDTYSTEGPGGCIAYDVRIYEACKSQSWACYSLSPEVFHHISAPSEITIANSGGDKVRQGMLEEQIHPSDKKHREVAAPGRKGMSDHPELTDKPLPMTPNIRCGARSGEVTHRIRQRDEGIRELNLNEVIPISGFEHKCPWDL